MKRLLFIVSLLSVVLPGSAADLTPDQKLVVACYRLDVESVVSLIRNGADVNATFFGSGEEVESPTDPFIDPWTGGIHVASSSWTPLIALAQSSDYPDPPANEVDVWQDGDRVRRLQKQFSKDQLEQRKQNVMVIFWVLLSHDCQLNSCDARGATALYASVDTDKSEFANALLKHGANPNTQTGVYIDGPGKTTPLHVACHSKEMLQLLLDHGADATAKDSNGRTPADWVSLRNERDFDLVNTTSGWKIVPRQ